MLKIEAFTLGLMIEANCYLVSEDGHALVIDPGSKGRSVQKRIEEMGLIVDAVLLTHGHFDHCAGAHSAGPARKSASPPGSHPDS